MEAVALDEFHHSILSFADMPGQGNRQAPPLKYISSLVLPHELLRDDCPRSCDRH